MTRTPHRTLPGGVYNLYGDIVAELTAPCGGSVFGLRSRLSVIEGQWCCFFGIIEQVLVNLILA